METISTPENSESWKEIVKRYAQPDLRRALWQTANSLMRLSYLIPE